MSPFYFAYGSNLKQDRLRQRIGAFRFVCRAVLADHRLVFDKPGIDGSGKANLRAAAGEQVWGVVYELEADGFARLDPFERGYARIRIEVRREDGIPLAAETYRFLPSTEDRGARDPSEEYRGLLLEGGREHGLPEAHLCRIAAVAVCGEPRRGTGG